MHYFQDRTEAGQLLAQRLLPYKKDRPIILAVPRGGVPVAAEVAKELQAPLDLLLIKKIGLPGDEELAIGALGEAAEPWLNQELISKLRVHRKDIDRVITQKKAELARQNENWRDLREHVEVLGRNLIVVDDGVATGATQFAAVKLLRQMKAKKIIVAVPLGPLDTLKKLKEVADEVIYLEAPYPFFAVGPWYLNFSQVSDQEVSKYLQNLKRKTHRQEEFEFVDGEAKLKADLTIVKEMKGLVIFAHGSDSSRKSPRNQFVAKVFNKAGFGTLLVDLLTEFEAGNRKNVFDVALLVRRVLAATDAVILRLKSSELPIAFFGASTGAAAALGAAVKTNHSVFAVISRGGRPDLAEVDFAKVNVPVLLIVGGEDLQVIALNKKVEKLLPQVTMVIVPGATHLFEESGALEKVAVLARNWLLENLPKKDRISIIGK